MRQFMYMRPGNLYKDFIIESSEETIGKGGRPQRKYDDSGLRILKGALCDATADEKMRWAQQEHPITHTITQQGKPKCKPEDKLVYNGRTFLVQGIGDVTDVGIATLYFVEERMDVE